MYLCQLMPTDHSNGMESLPKQFVLAMRTLFDIMDDKRTGYVRLTDIQNRWRDDRIKDLPRGVMDSLRKVASHDGMLTFERFCTGLKICLLQNQVAKAVSEPEPYEPNEEVQLEPSLLNKRLPPEPSLKNDDTHLLVNKWKSDDAQQHISTNMQQLLCCNEIPDQVARQTISVSGHDIPLRVFGPPKPPRAEKLTDRKESNTSYKVDDTILINNDIEEKRPYNISMESQSRGPGDGRSAADLMQAAARRGVRRKEPRRHTLHNGIDYNLLKRMKQMEQEKDVLLEGLTAVEEAREWYLKRLGDVQEKIRYAGRMGSYVEPWSEAQQERLELLRARVSELSRQLGSLAAGWRGGPLSLHMNLAVPLQPELHHTNVLRSQNKMLSEDVNRKTEKINTLEREKSALIRELMLQRNRPKIMDNFKLN